MTRPKIRMFDRLFAVLILCGGLFVVFEGASYDFGTLARIGPGFFPLIIGVSIVAIATVILIHTKADDVIPETPELRAITLLPIAVLCFAFLLERMGLVPAVLILTFIAIKADPSKDARMSVLITAAVVSLAVVMFHYIFHTPIPIFRWSILWSF